MQQKAVNDFPLKESPFKRKVFPFIFAQAVYSSQLKNRSGSGNKQLIDASLNFPEARISELYRHEVLNILAFPTSVLRAPSRVACYSSVALLRHLFVDDAHIANAGPVHVRAAHAYTCLVIAGLHSAQSLTFACITA